MSEQPHLHLSDVGIFEYAAGIASQSTSLAMACHLHFCEQCRQTSRVCDDVLEALVDSLPTVPLRSEALGELLTRLDDGPPKLTQFEPPPTVLPKHLERLALPPALRRFLGSARSLRWRMLVPGADSINFVPTDGSNNSVRLMRFRSGFEIPLHDHGGAEYTVIMTGHLADAGEIAGRGDVIAREAGDRHVQTVTSADECVALVVNEMPVVPLTIKGRLLRIIAGV